MQGIPPKERYSLNEKIADISDSFLAVACAQFGLSPKSATWSKLSGGFMNANHLIIHQGDKFVFRIYSSDQAVADREIGILRHLKNSQVLVPEVLEHFQIENRSVMVMNYLEGVTLEDKILSGETISPAFYHELGLQLAHIHQFKFDRSGFIGPDFSIGYEFKNLGTLIESFSLKTLAQVSKDRLDPQVNERLRKLIHDLWPQVMETEPRTELVHSDFNPKNILVSAGDSSQLIAILDWEHSLSGNGLADLGNFFRFAEDYTKGSDQHFIKGYSEIARLPDNWRDLVKLLDLGNMCSFLERKENYEKTFHTARTVIDSTLAYFHY